jgi:hypothetical protein
MVPGAARSTARLSPVAAGHEVSERIVHELAHRLPFALDAFIHADPQSWRARTTSRHHRLRMDDRRPQITTETASAVFG